MAQSRSCIVFALGTVMGTVCCSVCTEMTRWAGPWRLARPGPWEVTAQAHWPQVQKPPLCLERSAGNLFKKFNIKCWWAIPEWQLWRDKACNTMKHCNKSGLLRIDYLHIFITVNLWMKFYIFWLFYRVSGAAWEQRYLIDSQLVLIISNSTKLVRIDFFHILITVSFSMQYHIFWLFYSK